jgi:DNA-binding transcriptional MerR regulator
MSEQDFGATEPEYADTLFSDDLPSVDSRSGYRGTSAAKAVGISYRQLDYWDRTALVQPSVRGASGSGTQRLYSFRDVLVLKLVKSLLDIGVSLQQIRTAIEELRASGINELAGITLMSDGARVYLCTSHDGRGQGVFGIAVGKALREVEATLANIHADSVVEVDELASRREAKRAV